jgi:membrane protein involved in colicin uptake
LLHSDSAKYSRFRPATLSNSVSRSGREALEDLKREQREAEARRAKEQEERETRQKAEDQARREREARTKAAAEAEAALAEREATGDAAIGSAFRCWRQANFGIASKYFENRTSR